LGAFYVGMMTLEKCHTALNHENNVNVLSSLLSVLRHCCLSIRKASKITIAAFFMGIIEKLGENIGRSVLLICHML